MRGVDTEVMENRDVQRKILGFFIINDVVKQRTNEIYKYKCDMYFIVLRTL